MMLGEFVINLVMDFTSAIPVGNALNASWSIFSQ